jgi:PAS domain S-box-containing protein
LKIKKELKILLIEDSEDDAFLIEYQFNQNGYRTQVKRVETADNMVKALNASEWDVIICDYSLPKFSAPMALDILKEQHYDIPFIIVSGTIGEANAVAAMKAGAHDYIMKDKMARLVPAVEREMQDALSRKKRRQAEQALQDSEANYQEIFNAANDAITLHDPETGVILDANKRACEYLGFLRDELVGKNISDLISKEGRYRPDVMLNWLAGKLETESDIAEWQMLHKSGALLWTELNLKRTVIRGRKVILIIGRDINERKIFSEVLARSEERYRNVLENATDAIAIVENDEIRFANRRLEDLTGYNRAQILKQRWRDLIQRTDSGYENFNTEVDTELYDNLGFLLATSDGSNKRVELNHVQIEFDGKPANLYFILDITQQRKLEYRLKLAQKMEAIGTLAGGIAHDFNNILSPILGYTELVMDTLDPESKAYKNLSQVFSAANRARDLVQQILTFSRQSEREPIPLKIQLVITEAMKLLRASIPATITIKLSIDEKCPPVVADATQIYQIVMNLCTNAYQAMPDDRGVLSVSLDPVTFETAYVAKFSRINPGKYVLLKISDTGHGMEPNIIPRIFDPFFSTKKKEHGTGLGLSVVHGIVNRYKGFIDVFSEPGKGSTFKVFLPVFDTDVKSINLSGDWIEKGNQERILLVDDEKAILDFLKQLLQDLNYRVTTCGDSVKAVDLFRKTPAEFDIVITDQIMPNLTGDLLAKQLVQIRPDLPVILCTGFSENLDEITRHSKGIKSIVNKPVLKSDLASAIWKALHEK